MTRYTPDGHTAASGIFVVLGLWWIISTFWMHFISRKKHNDFQVQAKFKSFVPLPCCPKLPLQPILLIVYALVGFFIQLFIAITKNDDGNAEFVFRPWNIYKKNGELIIEKVQHLTFCSAFLIYGAVDLSTLCIPYPKHTSQVAFAFAMLIEAFMFYYHDIGHTILESIMHQLLSFSVFACALFAALRVHSSMNLLVNGLLALSLTLQGTWIFHIGYALHGGPTKWDEDDPENCMLAVCFFAMHVLVILLFMFALYTVLLYVTKWYKQISYKSIMKSSSQENEILLSEFS